MTSLADGDPEWPYFVAGQNERLMLVVDHELVIGANPADTMRDVPDAMQLPAMAFVLRKA